MSERERAQKMPGGDDPNGFALNLLITKAVDDAGSGCLLLVRLLS
jgi:hypothetical protein